MRVKAHDYRAMQRVYYFIAMIKREKTNKYRINWSWLLLFFMAFLVACNDSQPEGVEITPLPATAEVDGTSSFSPPTVEATALPPTPIPPTPTPQLAALVNGQPIFLADFEKELARFELAQAELGIEVDGNEQDYRQIVLDALIERELIHQAGVVRGVAVSDEIVDSKMRELEGSTSEHGSFDDWLVANQWTMEEFRAGLAAEMLVEEMVALVTADVPEAMEQVRVRYIQIDDGDLAQTLLVKLDEGDDFADLAQRYSLDQATAPYGGDLGYFARGSLLVPEVETAAFELELEEVSDIITVVDDESGRASYYIVQLIERDASRMIGANLRYRLLQETFETWLAEQRAGATITYLVED